MTPLDAGWAALSNGNWQGASASFAECLLDGETPEALEGMGWVGQMLNEDQLTFDARERAYRLYLEVGEKEHGLPASHERDETAAYLT